MALPQSPIRFAAFETEANTITCATATGFTIVNATNGNIISQCSTNNHPAFPNGTRYVSTIGNSNIVAITPNTDVSPNVYIWDRKKNQELTFTKFNESICGIRLRPDLLVAATSKQIQVRSLYDFHTISSFDTAFNKFGIFDIPVTLSSSLIAFPSPDIGVVTICDFLDPSMHPLYVHAFKTPILFIKFSNNGRLLAVAGDDGKTIAVFSVPSMKLIVTLRRGITETQILAMSFEPHGTQLAVVSEKGTLNVFPIAWAEQEGDSHSRAPIKLKDSDDHPGWVSFSAKTLKLCGVTGQGQIFEVVFDDQMKASLKMLSTPQAIR